MSLPAGTTIEGSSDPRTVEQNRTLSNLKHNEDGTISSQYMGSLLYPDGRLTKDYDILDKPVDRKADINAALAAGTDPAKPSGGYILILNTDGVPIQYVSLGSPPSVTPAPVVRSNAPTPSVVPGMPIKLTDIVKLSTTDVARQYVKGTLKAIDSQIITAINTSNNVAVQVSFTPRTGLVFDPATFLLAPNGIQTTTLTFDIASIDALNEGLTTYNIPIALTSPTAILPPAIPVPAPAPAPIVTPIPTPIVPVTIVEPVPPAPATPPEPGHWELTQVAPGSTSVEKVITLNAPMNGQGPQPENGFVEGMYNTVYGYNKTTVIGPTYDYQLVGNVYSAGTKPIPPAASITITEDSNKYQVLSNVLIMTMDAYRASLNKLPAPSAPEVPPILQPVTEVVVASSGGGGVRHDATMNSNATDTGLSTALTDLNMT